MGQFALVPLAQGRNLSNALPLGLARSRTASRLLPADHAYRRPQQTHEGQQAEEPSIPATSRRWCSSTRQS